MIREYVSRVPRMVWIVTAVGATIILTFILWFYSAHIINAIGRHYYQKEMDAAKADVQRQLDQAAEQKRELDRTLIQLEEAKKSLAAADLARIEAEKVLNDKTKTANEKVAAFRNTLNDVPLHADTVGITTDDLCVRAKANQSSADVIAALCH